MLILNEGDILQAVSMNELIDAIEQSYILYENKQYQMPLRSQIFDEENTLLLMPAIANRSMGTKIVSVFPKNRDTPVTQGLVILNDRENGETKAILNGTLLTGLKTGATGGAAIKHLASPAAQSVGLIGTGFQGLYQLIAACAVRDIRHIHLYNRTASKLPAFIDVLKNHLTKNVEIHVKDNTTDLVRDSDIVITSTTSKTPVLPDVKSIFNGKLIVGIGSYQPQMREFSEQLYKGLENVYIDTDDATLESGDICDPLNHKWLNESQVVPFSKVVTGKVKPILADNRPSVFKSVGMALFDLVVAEVIYEKASQQNIGLHVDL